MRHGGRRTSDASRARCTRCGRSASASPMAHPRDRRRGHGRHLRDLDRCSADRYRATSTVLVQNSTVQGILGAAPAHLARACHRRPGAADRHRARSPSGWSRGWGLNDTPDSLRATSRRRPSPGSNFVSVTADRASASSAADVANAFVREFISLGQEQLKAEIDNDASPTARAAARDAAGDRGNAEAAADAARRYGARSRPQRCCRLRAARSIRRRRPTTPGRSRARSRRAVRADHLDAASRSRSPTRWSGSAAARAPADDWREEVMT